MADIIQFPTPAPEPTGACGYCGGCGRVGDGNQIIECPKCEGAGEIAWQPT